MRGPDDEDGGGEDPDHQPPPPPLPPHRLPSPQSFLPNFSQPSPSSPPLLDNLLDGERGFFGVTLEMTSGIIQNLKQIIVGQ